MKQKQIKTFSATAGKLIYISFASMPANFQHLLETTESSTLHISDRGIDDAIQWYFSNGYYLLSKN